MFACEGVNAGRDEASFSPPRRVRPRTTRRVASLYVWIFLIFYIFYHKKVN